MSESIVAIPVMSNHTSLFVSAHLMTCRSVKIGSSEVALGDVIALTAVDDEAEEEDTGTPLALLQALWQTPQGELHSIGAC